MFLDSLHHLGIKTIIIFAKDFFYLGLVKMQSEKVISQFIAYVIFGPHKVKTDDFLFVFGIVCFSDIEKLLLSASSFFLSFSVCHTIIF